MTGDPAQDSGKHSDGQPRVGPESPDPMVTDSDPNGDGPHGLSGGMGVSSERTGRVPGSQGEATHGAVDPYPELPTDEDPPPEQSGGGSDVHSDNDLPPHRLDPGSAEGHSHG